MQRRLLIKAKFNRILAKNQNSSLSLKERVQIHSIPKYEINQFLMELNRLRAQNGLKLVTLNSELTTFAQGRSETLKKIKIKS